MKVKLKRDFKKYYEFKSGMTGVCGGSLLGGRDKLVTFDGFEEEKKRSEEYRVKYGESPNIVPWLAIIPVEYLEEIK